MGIGVGLDETSMSDNINARDKTYLSTAIIVSDKLPSHHHHNFYITTTLQELGKGYN